MIRWLFVFVCKLSFVYFGNLHSTTEWQAKSWQHPEVFPGGPPPQY